MLLFQLALAFGLELVALIAFGMWGYRLSDHGALRVFLASGLPFVVAVLWGTFLSPKAQVTLTPGLKTSLRLLVFALAAFALLATGHAVGAVLFALLVVFNTGVLRLLRVDPAQLR